MSMYRPDLRCPNCWQIDRVEKVSTIVARETRTGHSSGTTVGTAMMTTTVPVNPLYGIKRTDRSHGTMASFSEQRSIERSELAKRLLPPPEPLFEAGFRGCLKGTGIAGLVFTIICLALWTLCELPQAIANHNMQSIVVPDLLFLFLFVVFIGVFIVLWLLSAPGERARREAFYEEQRQWQYAMERWNRLYYCHRCDHTFCPD
jgi:hypothetical protein